MSSLENDCLCFMGIPIDGSKRDFIRELERKGFRAANDYIWKGSYEGEFNGQNVHVFIQTTHEKVSRIAVRYPLFRGEIDARIQYNTLLRQLEESGKYYGLASNSIINENTDLLTEITVKGKRYEADFLWFSPKTLSEHTLTYSKSMGLFDGIVWFLLDQIDGKYTITLFYENSHNYDSASEDL